MEKREHKITDSLILSSCKVDLLISTRSIKLSERETHSLQKNIPCTLDSPCLCVFVFSGKLVDKLITK